MDPISVQKIANLENAVAQLAHELAALKDAIAQSTEILSARLDAIEQARESGVMGLPTGVKPV